jgi:hypothetical protein
VKFRLTGGDEVFTFGWIVDLVILGSFATMVAGVFFLIRWLLSFFLGRSLAEEDHKEKGLAQKH